jgi:hypothetical protein
MINPKPTLSGIALSFGDKRDLQNESSVSCPALIDCASCHNLYANRRTGLYGNPLHQNRLKEIFEENIFFPTHPPWYLPFQIEGALLLSWAGIVRSHLPG